MYYKVMYNGQVINTLDHLNFVKYQAKHGIMVNCTADDAEGIVSSDGRYIWHVDGYYNVPVPGYDTVQLEEINVYEYDKLKALGAKTPEAIIDAYTLSLIEGGVL